MQVLRWQGCQRNPQAGDCCGGIRAGNVHRHWGFALARLPRTFTGPGESCWQGRQQHPQVRGNHAGKVAGLEDAFRMHQCARVLATRGSRWSWSRASVVGRGDDVCVVGTQGITSPRPRAGCCVCPACRGIGDCRVKERLPAAYFEREVLLDDVCARSSQRGVPGLQGLPAQALGGRSATVHAVSSMGHM